VYDGPVPHVDRMVSGTAHEGNDEMITASHRCLRLDAPHPLSAGCVFDSTGIKGQ
jgi:hypothetical protein